MFEDTKGVIRSCKSKGRQLNAQWTKDNDKTENGVPRTPLNTGDELWCSEKVSRSSYTFDTSRVTLVINQMISHT